MKERRLAMFTEITIIIKKFSKALAVPYKRNAYPVNKGLTKDAAFGGFTQQDWDNVGNDIRRGILDYGNSRFR